MQQSELELRFLHGNGSAASAVQALEAIRRHLAAHPEALRAVLLTARALRRTPDAVSVKQVEDWGCSN
jgi:hypothetical protein